MSQQSDGAQLTVGMPFQATLIIDLRLAGLGSQSLNFKRIMKLMVAIMYCAASSN